MKDGRIFFRYLIRNAFLPPLTGLAIRLGFIITGAAIAENYFQYNGLGQTLGAAISNFDYFLIYGIVIIVVMLFAPAGLSGGFRAARRRLTALLEGAGLHHAAA